jgi:DNA-binding NtrC family response regulator
MTAFGTTETAIEATKAGAFDYVLKPFEIPDVLVLIEQALETGRLMRSRIEMDVAASARDVDAIVGSSEAMQEVYKAIGRAAPTDATVLVRGESGTGKELVARAIYQHSHRSEKPLLVINCVAIPETLLESELFGYEKGAFTGAANRRIGKIEQANGGTVFLDEIGDMPVSIQAKILRLLQERSIERLGGCEPIPVDVRMIAATNRDLEQAIVDGRFREDLYYRLNVISIELPPLRDRIADVPQLCEYFLARFSQELDMPNPGITEEAVALLRGHAWPGNVRELANTLQKALILGRGGPVRAEDVAQAIAGGEGDEVTESTDIETAIRQWIRDTLVSEEQGEPFTRLMDRFAGIVLTEALTLTGGNRSKAAQLLGISRPTLQARIQKHGVKSETTFRSQSTPSSSGSS